MATLTQMITDIRTELADGGSAVLSDAQITRAVAQAVDELSRFYPLQAFAETVFVLDVDGETFTSDHDTAVALANKAIKSGSETVSIGSTTYTYGTDYTMDYINGTITVLSTGSIADATSTTISYDRDQSLVDLTDILTRPISVNRVEYRIGQTPQDFHYQIVYTGDNSTTVAMFLLLTSEAGGNSQSRVLSNNTNIRIYYEAYHNPPGASSNGTFPRFLDEPVVRGAAGFALRIAGITQRHQVATDLASSRTELGKVQAILDIMNDTQNDGASDDARDTLEWAYAEVQLASGNITATETAITNAATSITSQGSSIASAASEAALANTALDAVAAIITGITGAGLEGIIDDAESLLAGIGSALDALRGSAGEPWDEADALLDTVETELLDIDTSADSIDSMIDGVSDSIDNTADEIAALITELDTALDRVNEELNSATRNADDYLNQGDALLNTVNQGGPQVAGDYAVYANSKIEMARAHTAEAGQRFAAVQGKIGEASIRVEAVSARMQEFQAHVGVVSSYIEATNARLRTGELLIAEAQARIGYVEAHRVSIDGRLAQINAYIGEATQRIATAQAYTDQAAQHGAAAQGHIGRAQALINLETLRMNSVQAAVGVAQAWVASAGALRDEALTNIRAAESYQAGADRVKLLADDYLTEAERRIEEFRATIRDAAQISSGRYQASSHQYHV